MQGSGLTRPAIFLWQKRQELASPFNLTMKLVRNRLRKSPFLARNLRASDYPKGRNVNWKAGLMILVTLVLILAVQPRLSMYSMEEAFTVLLGIAVLLILLLLTVIAFLLLWQGAGFVFLRLKRIVELIISVRGRPRVLDRP